MEISQSSMLLSSEIPTFDVKVLEGHTSEVWTYLFDFLLFYPLLYALLKIILFLTGFCLCMESIRFTSCVWVRTSSF